MRWLASLDALPTAVRSAIHELYDGVDDPPGTCSIPLNYEQAIPLIPFINHSKRPSCAYDEEARKLGKPLNFDANGEFMPKQTSSQYRGVSWNTRRKKWAASIMVEYKTRFLGYFDDEVEAARAYDKEARILGRELMNFEATSGDPVASAAATASTSQPADDGDGAGGAES